MAGTELGPGIRVGTREGLEPGLGQGLGGDITGKGTSSESEPGSGQGLSWWMRQGIRGSVQIQGLCQELDAIEPSFKPAKPQLILF